MVPDEPRPRSLFRATTDPASDSTLAVLCTGEYRPDCVWRRSGDSDAPPCTGTPLLDSNATVTRDSILRPCHVRGILTKLAEQHRPHASSTSRTSEPWLSSRVWSPRTRAAQGEKTPQAASCSRGYRVFLGADCSGCRLRLSGSANIVTRGNDSIRIECRLEFMATMPEGVVVALE